MISTRKEYGGNFITTTCLNADSRKFKKATKINKKLNSTFQMIPCSIPKNYITGSTCSATIRNDDDVFNEAWQNRPNKRANKCLTGRELNSSSPQYSWKWKNVFKTNDLCTTYKKCWIQFFSITHSIALFFFGKIKKKMLNLAFSPKKVDCPFIALFLDCFRPTVKLPIPTVAPPFYLW